MRNADEERIYRRPPVKKYDKKFFGFKIFDLGFSFCKPPPQKKGTGKGKEKKGAVVFLIVMLRLSLFCFFG